MNLKKMIQDLMIEIDAVEQWIMQLGLCLEQTNDQDPDYITLLLQEAGAIEYLEELRQLLEELQKQQEEQQKNGRGDEEEEEEEPQEQQGQQGSAQGAEGEGEDEEPAQEDPQEKEDEGDEEGEAVASQAIYGEEDQTHKKAGEGHVAPAPRGVNQMLWDLIGEKNYLEYIKFAPVELATHVQKGTIAGREHSYKMPRPDGKVITRRTLVQRVKYNGEAIKLAYIPEIHTVVWDK